MTLRNKTRGPRSGGWLRLMLACLALVGLAAAVGPFAGVAREVDAESSLPLAPPGTRFEFEIIESRDALYLGDTPSHFGKDGGLTVRPQVALGDPVYRGVAGGRMLVGRVTRVAWSRVSGSLGVEFHPVPLLRIAVGEEVWVDLNPAVETEAE